MEEDSTIYLPLASPSCFASYLLLCIYIFDAKDATSTNNVQMLHTACCLFIFYFTFFAKFHLEYDFVLFYVANDIVNFHSTTFFKSDTDKWQNEEKLRAEKH